MTAESPEMSAYFESLETEMRRAYEIAGKARQKGYDPEPKVDIPLAKNMAERVEGLISIVAPQLVGKGIIERMHELEEKYGILDWRVALIIAEEVAQEKFCTFKDRREALEVGIRTGFAYHTLGIVAAPLEGFISLEIKKRRDGKEYLSPMYAGPIRGAGGTAAAFSVLLTDYMRIRMGYAPYDPDEEEVARVKTEIMDYHERVTNLQYYPSQEEIDFLVRHIPVEVGGDPTEEIEVSQHKDLPRIETNMIRGGVCLVIAEGISQKAPKLWKRISQWGKEFGLEWGFLEEFLSLQTKIKSKSAEPSKEEKKLMPNYTYLKDLVGGRPVLTHPMRVGGFRLRYGRSRVSGYSSAAMHPITQFLLNNYIAIGTQLKVERPGKAAAVTTCDTIDGPIVKLVTGDVLQLSTFQDYNLHKSEVKEILYLGDILFNYGDFSENNHKLVPPGYCDEWWILELEKAIVSLFGSFDRAKLAEFAELTEEEAVALFEKPNLSSSADICIKISYLTKIALHPKFTFFWNSLTTEELSTLLNWLTSAKIIRENNVVSKIVLPYDSDKKLILEKLGIPHVLATNEFAVIEGDYARVFALNLSMENKSPEELSGIFLNNPDKDALAIVNLISPIPVRDKGGTFIGARMGRPEKAKMRALTGSPHALFPVGDEGGRLRSIQAAMLTGNVTADFPINICRNCGKETIFNVCEMCESPTKRMYYCRNCGIIEKEMCEKCNEKARPYKNRSIDISHYFTEVLTKLGYTNYPDLIKGVRGTSNAEHLPEHLAKGILRSKYDVYVNKDGTTRYDMSELAITHFKPKEIGTSVEKLKEMGYEKDINGKKLVDDDQILEIKCQDIILPGNKNTTDEPADTVLLRISKFVDEELVNFYGIEPFYKLESGGDLVGELVVGLAPHISAGMIGRIIGFSQVQGCFAHPLWHAALRRDCDGDECCVILLMDAFLNFSRKFLPDKRGGRTMDSPLVLTYKLIPAEVDDMVLGLDVAWRYPLEFYEAAMQYKKTGEVKVEQLRERINKEGQYEGMGFTHDTANFNNGVKCSAYKTLPSMEDKIRGQMEIAERVRAVDQTDVATLVIEKHFLKDIKGNLRKFSMQEFRCGKCNEKYRRPPLAGKCEKCGGKIIFTISEGSVIKYLEPSISIAEKYGVHPYLRQTLELLSRRIDSFFGKEKEKQEGLGKWFG
jgi:DNA polymerase II large subunit